MAFEDQDVTQEFNTSKVKQTLLSDILRVIANNQASYPSEIAHKVNASTKKVASICHKLKDADVLESLSPKLKHYDGRIQKRMMGVPFEGVKEMKKPNWYGLNKELDWVLKNNTDGEWYNEYHEPICAMSADESNNGQNMVNVATSKLKENDLFEELDA